MPAFTTRRYLPYTSRQMFDLVADVEQYPKFLPLCEGLLVRRRERQGDREVLIADLSVGYKSISETFTTRVTLDPDPPAIVAEYLDGPFSRLENRWRFLERPGGCEVDFFIDYEFKSPMLGMLVGAAFDSAFRRFTDAFERRAGEVYGSSFGQPATA